MSVAVIAVLVINSARTLVCDLVSFSWMITVPRWWAGMETDMGMMCIRDHNLAREG